MKNIRPLAQMTPPVQGFFHARRVPEILEKKLPYSIKSLVKELASFRRVHPAPLRLFCQNTALLPDMFYDGNDQQGAFERLVVGIRVKQPDIVGLCEIFVDGERANLVHALKQWYPFTLDAPDQGDHEEDSGLLLLSRHPIIAHHWTVYDEAAGDDEWANKGVIHARVRVADHPADYDVFLTHMQDAAALPLTPSVAWEALQNQLDQLNAFIQIHSHPNRPAILMGDLNVNGLDASRYAFLIKKLGEAIPAVPHSKPSSPIDQWKASGDKKSPGITSDLANTFGKEIKLAPDAEARHKLGERLDYMITWAGENRLYHPVHTRTTVEVWQSSPGVDMSDHYGLETTQAALLER